jgi:hypothetical protein
MALVSECQKYRSLYMYCNSLLKVEPVYVLVVTSDDPAIRITLTICKASVSDCSSATSTTSSLSVGVHIDMRLFVGVYIHAY